MKLVLKSNMNILDDKFIEHLISVFPKVVFTKQNMRKISTIDRYLQQNVFVGKRKYTTKQIVDIVLKNIVYKTDGKTAVIEFDNYAVFPFYTFKIKDIANLIDKGNLEIRGTHIFSNLFSYIKDHILQLRNSYEIGML